MESLSSIQRFEEKLQWLAKKHQTLREENAALKSQVSEQQAEIKNLQNALAILENKLHLLKIAAGKNGERDEEEKKELRTVLNHYIKEIDRCIALLNA